MRTSEMDVDSSSKFIASLTKFLQSLCNGYVDFENGVELVGHIYLSVDTGKKIDYILHEKVCKNDENSVTFISNSFHAQPFDKTKSQTKQQVDTFKGKTRSDKVRDVDKEETVGRKDDDEDVVIVNATKGALENSDGASMGTRGRKRPASPSSEQQFQRPFRRNAEGSLSSPSSSAQQSGQSGSGVLGSNGLRRKAQPSATITSQEDQTDSFSSSDLKLEHMTTDELLSLASQVSDSSCSASIIPPATGSGSRSTGGEPSNQQVWVKQEAPDDDDSCLASGSGDSAHGQSWPLGRDPQNDTNSGSGGLYPVMLHQNTAAFPGPGGPFPAGFPPLSGGPSSSQHPAFTQQSSSQAAANLFASPVPGTSQGGGAVDSAESTMPLELAVQAVMMQGVSFRKAAKLFGVGISQLFSSVSKRRGKVSAPRTGLLRKDDEQLLVRRGLEVAHLGVKATRVAVTTLAAKLAEKNRQPFKNYMPCYVWWHKFRRTHAALDEALARASTSAAEDDKFEPDRT
ncbi:uncharacterized protein LOC112563532 isoform X5 [Pomacea canaliculata]|nr:uncharacterized protein LOC112563532 isoform X5 [Pomacea canaliculata]